MSFGSPLAPVSPTPTSLGLSNPSSLPAPKPSEVGPTNAAAAALKTQQQSHEAQSPAIKPSGDRIARSQAPPKLYDSAQIHQHLSEASATTAAATAALPRVGSAVADGLSAAGQAATRGMPAIGETIASAVSGPVVAGTAAAGAALAATTAQAGNADESSPHAGWRSSSLAASDRTSVAAGDGLERQKSTNVDSQAVPARRQAGSVLTTATPDKIAHARVIDAAGHHGSTTTTPSVPARGIEHTGHIDPHAATIGSTSTPIEQVGSSTTTTPAHGVDRASAVSGKPVGPDVTAAHHATLAKNDVASPQSLGLNLTGKQTVKGGVEQLTYEPVNSAGAKTGKLVVQDEANLSPSEWKTGAELARGGHEVTAIPRSGEKTADFLVDGKPTELKTMSNAKTDSAGTSVTKTIKAATKQGKNVIIDARSQSGLTEADAQRAVERAVRELPKSRINEVRLFGQDGNTSFEIVVKK
jgi:hypothetical protein